MAKKWNVVKKDNKRVVVERKSDGKQKVLLTPNGKGAKYSAELKNGVRITNTGKRKKSDDGKPMKLTKAQRAYRSGYLNARKDNAKAYKSKRN